jgi:hypothetical protein
LAALSEPGAGEYNEFSKDGKTTRSSGEWIFGWVMDGRAIQDLFIIHSSEARKERYIGMTLRYFDPKSGTWSATFIDPESGAVETLTGGAVGGDRIVLLSQNTDGGNVGGRSTILAPIHGSFALRRPATTARHGGYGRKIA